jgi:hypothetical protein
MIEVLLVGIGLLMGMFVLFFYFLSLKSLGVSTNKELLTQVIESEVS